MQQNTFFGRHYAGRGRREILHHQCPVGHHRQSLVCHQSRIGDGPVRCFDIHRHFDFFPGLSAVAQVGAVLSAALPKWPADVGQVPFGAPNPDHPPEIRQTGTHPGKPLLPHRVKARAAAITA